MLRKPFFSSLIMSIFVLHTIYSPMSRAQDTLSIEDSLLPFQSEASCLGYAVNLGACVGAMAVAGAAGGSALSRVRDSLKQERIRNGLSNMNESAQKFSQANQKAQPSLDHLTDFKLENTRIFGWDRK